MTAKLPVYFSFVGYKGKQSAKKKVMWQKLKAFYEEYKEYVRVDLIMYAVMILLIILYAIFAVLT
ncbi:MAG: hypothetical protein JNK10_12885 [Cyclobacteriaceae bacterium]|nr:hypothetical protein [Cyclobacteriaceae bacterium]